MFLLSVAQAGLASTNATLWFGVNSGTVRNLRAVTYGNDQFIAVGDGAILTSGDGINWTPRNSGLSASTGLSCIAFGGGLFVAGGISGILASRDGIEWTQLNTGVAASGITYGNGLFVAVFSGSEIRLSLDAVKWIAADNAKGQGVDFSGIAFGNNQFVAVGTDANAGSGAIVSSSDGIVWIRRDINPSLKLQAVAYGNGMFMAVGDTILTSSNGVAWTNRAGLYLDLLGVAYGGNDEFVLVGRGGVSIWNGRGGTGAEGLRGIAYGNNKIVAVGDNGKILTSMLAPLPIPMILGPIRLLPDGTVQSSVSGKPGQSFLIQASTNLTDWVPLTVLTATTNATVQFTDPSANKFSGRFYRAVSP